MVANVSPKAKIQLPRAWLDVTEALALAGRFGGRSYAVVPRRLDGLVGPFRIGQAMAPGELLRRVAQAAGVELTEKDKTPVFELPATENSKRALADIGSDDAVVRRRAAFTLGESQRLDAVAPLVAALGDGDPAVRRAAALALASLEGAFETNQWPGRVSVFELPGVSLDTEVLLWLVEDGAEPGSREWLAAVSILGRARSGELSRSLWWHVWLRRPGAVRAAVRALGRCGDPDMRRTLEQLLSRPGTNRESDRYEAAAALGKIGEIRRLAACDPEKTAVEVRCAAAYGLGFCPTAEAHNALGRMLADPDSRVGELAALSLGRHDSNESVELLARVLADDGVPAAVRSAAADGLARSERPKAREALLDAARSGNPSAAEALGTAGGSEAAEVLASLLGADGRWLAAAAARSLASLGTADSIKDLAGVLTRGDTDPEVRIAVALGLGQGRAPEAAGPLSDVVRDDTADLRLRMYAARSLAMLANRAGQETLRGLLEGDPPLQLRLVALRTLDLGDPDETVKTLTWWATHGKPRHEQATACERIGQIGTAEGTRFLAGGYDTFDNYTRWACIWPLIQNTSATVRRALIDLLGSRRRTVRTNAAIALGGPGGADAPPPDPAAVDALIAACEDPSESVRVVAADSLGLLGDPSAAAALIRVLERDESPRAAHHALRALRRREFASLPEVRAALERVRKTRRDAGSPGGPPLRDQPAHSFVLRCWDRDYDDESIPNLTYESTVCYDGATGRVVQWGSHGRRYDTPQTGMTWLFDTGAGTWRRPLPAQEPPGICNTRGLAADAARGLVVSPKSPTGQGGHGYVMYLRKFAGFSMPWVFDTRREEWVPMRPLAHPGSGPQASACFDWQNDAMILYRRGPQVYDTHANEWVPTNPPEPHPDEVAGAPGAYDPGTGRFIVVAGADELGRAKTWAYDLRADRWEDLRPANPPPALGCCPMVYDSVNRVMLVFRPRSDGTAVYAYHPAENRWESLPRTTPAPCYVLLDATYDPLHNVTVLCGGEQCSGSGALTVRETWTYRYRPSETNRDPLAGVCRMLALGLSGNGAVTLTWTPPGVEVAAYHVYRAAGGRPWTARFERVAELGPDVTRFVDSDRADGAAARCYQIRVVLPEDGEEWRSNVVRTRPAPVREVFAARRADGSVDLSWRPSDGPAVVGYNVYRAEAQPVDLWASHFDAAAHADEFVKLNAEPVRDEAFTDAPGIEAGRCSESSWAPFHVYVVRAVNALGEESGPSPATLSIPAAPGPVVVVPLEEGGHLVVAGPGGSRGLAGHHLYRLDCYRGDLAFRTGGGPRPGTVFLDGTRWPEGDRRAYYVVGVDELGQLGISSAPGWARGVP